MTLTKENQDRVVAKAITCMKKQKLDPEIALEDALEELFPEAIKINKKNEAYFTLSDVLMQNMLDNLKTQLVKKQVQPNSKLCLCGCGRPVRKNRHFVMGHDAKITAIIKRIEHGTATEADIPESAKQAMVRCTRCGTMILPHKSGMGPVCRKK